ncbi:MAG: beta-CASP ribonuclease aCPSF1 [Candidatus Diapherotrites archaeon]
MEYDYLKEIKETINSSLPAETQITNVEMWGPEVAIYTKNPSSFFDNENYVAKIAFELKKRVNIRADKSLLIEHDLAKEKILKIIPEDAGIKEIYFNDAFSEVVIEALKPGLVIGKGGETSKQISRETGWTATNIRAPTSDSEILKGIRHHLHKYAGERKKILQETANKIYGEKIDDNSWVRLSALGGFREVGRSCMLVETKSTKVMLDCGVNVANPDERFPYLESLRFPVNEIDAIVISHAHLDHSGFLPYLFKLGYRGPVYCTLPTRDLMTLLQFDYIDVLVKERKEPPYSERDVKETLKHCITRDYREVTDIAPDMRLTLHNAAHILGSSSIHLHIGEGAHNLVYTGDLKFGFTRLFNNADVRYPRLETLIIESTYGARDDIQPQRQDAEDKLLRVINETVKQGGNVLIPVFSVGRAQEILLVIENFYRNGVLDARVFVDGMTKEASAIHTAYPEYLRKGVQRRILQNDSPFTSDLFQVANGKDRDKIAEGEGSIIMASSGMLTGGPSVHYLHKLAEDPKNCLIFVGYQGEGSTGRKLQSGISALPITSENGRARELKINMRVETIEGFSGHSDRAQLVAYIRNLKPKPKKVLVNHGDKFKTLEFGKFISSKFKINTSVMRNLDALRLR